MGCTLPSPELGLWMAALLEEEQEDKGVAWAMLGAWARVLVKGEAELSAAVKALMRAGQEVRSELRAGQADNEIARDLAIAYAFEVEHGYEGCAGFACRWYLSTSGAPSWSDPRRRLLTLAEMARNSFRQSPRSRRLIEVDQRSGEACSEA